MSSDIYKNFKKIFIRFKHKPIVLYGHGETTKEIIYNNKDFNIAGIYAEKKGQKKNLYDAKLLSFKEIKLLKPIIIIAAKKDLTGDIQENSKIIFKELEFLKKFGISIFFLNGTTDLPQINLSQFKKYHIKYKKLDKLIKKNDVISFDLFDTLIYRSCSKSRDVYQILDFYIKNYLKLKIDLYSLRTEAESFLHKLYPNFYSIDQIYQEIKKRTNLPANIINKIKKEEKRIEYCLATPNKQMISYFKLAKNLNKKVIITTDFYMDKKFLITILNKCKLYGYKNIFVSSELKKSKSNREIYLYIKNKFGKNKNFLHIGDNKTSDVIKARKSGFTACYINNSTNLIFSTNLSKLYSVTNNIFDKITLGLVQNKIHTIYNNSHNFGKNKIMLNDPTFFGYIFFGPLIFCYMLWLIQQSKKKSINKIFFCSREGYCLIQIYNFLKKKISFPRSIYFKTSRRLAAVSSLTTKQNIYKSFKFHRFFGNFSDLLKKRFNVKVFAHDPNKNKIVNTSENLKPIKFLLNPYVKAIINNAKNERKNYLKYLKNIINFKKDKITIADAGFHGTVQNSLAKITKKEFFGLYFSFNPTNKNRFLKRKKYGFYNFPNSNYYKNCHIFESVMTASHGTFLYCKKNGRFVNSKQKFSNQRKFYIKKMMHKGILSFCKDFVSAFPNFAQLSVKNSLSDAIYGEHRNKIFKYSKKIKNSFYFDNEYVRKEENLISF